MSLLKIMQDEREALSGLKDMLVEQYQYIMKNDVFGLEGIVSKIQGSNKNVAQCEVNRRKELAGKSLKEVIKTDYDLSNEYDEINKVIEEIRLQKETNELLIKQQLVLTNKMLAIINPSREQKTYNSYPPSGFQSSLLSCSPSCHPGRCL